jgi:hypothetical protein
MGMGISFLKFVGPGNSNGIAAEVTTRSIETFKIKFFFFAIV